MAKELTHEEKLYREVWNCKKWLVLIFIVLVIRLFII